MRNSNQTAALSHLVVVLRGPVDGGIFTNTDLVSCGASLASLTCRSEVEGSLKTWAMGKDPLPTDRFYESHKQIVVSCQ